MLGSLSYDEIKKLSDSLSNSSNTIRQIVTKYNDELADVVDFCNSLDAYAKFIDSSINLNKDADEALKYMIEKNK